VALKEESPISKHRLLERRLAWSNQREAREPSTGTANTNSVYGGMLRVSKTDIPREPRVLKSGNLGWPVPMAELSLSGWHGLGAVNE
jgi:hypothetical protein